MRHQYLWLWERYCGISQIIIIFLWYAADAVRLVCWFYRMCKKGTISEELPSCQDREVCSQTVMTTHLGTLSTCLKEIALRIHSVACSALSCSESDYFPSIWMIGYYYVPEKRLEATACGCHTILHSVQFNEEQSEELCLVFFAWTTNGTSKC